MATDCTCYSQPLDALDLAVMGDNHRVRAQNGASPSGRHLAAAMFIDMVGFSRRMQESEQTTIAHVEELWAIVRQSLKQFSGEEIDTAGDGMLVEFSAALRAVQCVLDMMERLQERNKGKPSNEQIHVRASVHLGELEHREGKIYGDGVNIAARLLGLAPPSAIAISSHVRDQLLNALDHEIVFLGNRQLKNIRDPMAIYCLAGPECLDSDITKATYDELLGGPEKSSTLRFLPRVKQVGTAAAFLALLISGWFSFFGDGVWPSTDDSSEDSELSVAVLPFKSLSANPEHKYFAEGLHDTLLTELSRISRVRLVSRTSVQRFAGDTRALTDIGKELGVRYLVEGSVQYAGQRILLNAQLIDASSDSHVWAEHYDHTVEDVFQLQSTIAGRIATAIKVTLSDDELARLEPGQSIDSEATEFYLRALAAMNTDPSAWGDEVINNALRAVELAPGFAKGHALLARICSLRFAFDSSQSYELRQCAQKAAASALERDPGLGEAYWAQGLYLYYVQRNLNAALEPLNRAAEMLPGQPEVKAYIAYILRRLGRWHDALHVLESAIDRNPLNPRLLVAYGEVLFNMHRYRDAVRISERLHRVRLPSPQSLQQLHEARFALSGDSSDLMEGLSSLDEIDVKDPCRNQDFSWLKFANWLKQYEIAWEAFTQCDGPYFGAWPREFTEGTIALMSGDLTRAKGAFQRALPVLEEYVSAAQSTSSAGYRYAYLGIAKAAIGDSVGASAALNKAIDQAHASDDKFRALDVRYLATLGYVYLGNIDRALSDLPRLLDEPSSFSARELATYPMWQPLWTEERFEKIIAPYLAAQTK